MPGNEPSVDASSLLLPDLPSGGPGTATAKTKARRPKPAGPKPGTDAWWDRWLTSNMLPLRSNDHYDIWRCTSCGAPLIHAKQSGKHGGPSHRMLDRRYGIMPCWRVSEGGWRTIESSPHGPGARVLVRHDSRPQSEQPTQSSSLAHLTGESPRSVANYGKVPRRVVYSTRATSVGATVTVPCVEPKGSVLRVSDASMDTVPLSSSATLPTKPESSSDDWQPPW
jgi:hypothetical protein